MHGTGASRIRRRPVGISRFTCVFHLSSWGVALASSTYDPPSNGRASNDVTGFPRFPLVPSYRRGTTDVACILLFYLPIRTASMHAPFLPPSRLLTCTPRDTPHARCGTPLAQGVVSPTKMHLRPSFFPSALQQSDSSIDALSSSLFSNAFSLWICISRSSAGTVPLFIRIC